MGQNQITKSATTHSDAADAAVASPVKINAEGYKHLHPELLTFDKVNNKK